jgi:hypothetical protein
MSQPVNRRGFLGTAMATGALTVVPRHVLGGEGHIAPNDRLALAHIGFGTQTIREVGGLLDDPRVQVVSICDPNADSTDYVEWGRGGILKRIRSYLKNDAWRADEKGCPGGRNVGREIVDGYYARTRGAGKFKGCTIYADFREMLEQEKDLDGVKILTPDHVHATLAIAAMKKGLHVMMHKPVANRLAEGRRVLETVRQMKKATHLLAYGSGAGNGKIVERIREGVIGRLREIHNWTNRPVWPQYTEIPADRPPVPKGFDWDLWLGPAIDRPYHPHYTHTVYRGWYEFGGGSMADMGNYSLWPVFTGLELVAPVSAEAWGSHTCAIVNGVSRPVRNDFAYPHACTIRLSFAARGDRPAIELFWYDGGMKPRLPAELESRKIRMGREGILFVGDDGAILAGFHGQNPRLFAKGKEEPLKMKADPPGAGKGGRHEPWIRACQGGNPSPGCFENAAAMTDAVNLGTVALRAGRKVEFDAKDARITNVSEANRFLTREYRKGWEL